MKPETLERLQMDLNEGMQAVVDGWAAQNPKELLRLEASGELIPLAKAEQDKEVDAQYRAMVENGGNPPPLSDREVAEVYGGASRTL